MRLPSGGATVIAKEIDVGESVRGPKLRAIHSPFVVVYGLGRAFTGVVVARHEREDILEVLDWGNGILRADGIAIGIAIQAEVPVIEVNIAGQLATGRVIVSCTLGIDEVD